MFNPADIDREYFDFVRLMRTSDGYWAVPTAVRSLGLFYNKKLLGEAASPGPSHRRPSTRWSATPSPPRGATAAAT
jgi:ABC-type glycerol-3-phosphate transport system substrate-binding protein